jgi:polyisoprenoid-binding protein YceI
MRKYRWLLLLCITILLAPQLVLGQRYTPSEKESKVEFSVKYHKNGEELVKGKLTGIKGTITFDPAHLETSSFDVTVNPGTTHTGDAARDKELIHESFFSQSLYPTIHIKSTSITTDRPGSIIYVLHGNLTMKDVIRPVTIQFTATKMGSGYLFRGGFDLNRLDYHLGEKGDIDNNVSTFIELRANKK